MSVAAIKACPDRMVPNELLYESMRRAVVENPANAPAVSRRALPPGVTDVPRVYLAAITGKTWQPGRTLRVHFLDGDPEVQARIPSFANRWTEHANINFAFVDDPDAEIRISFQNQGSWSYIGTDAMVIPAGQPTMNFGWLTPTTPDEEYARVVVHEFGHALACIHEHQNPDTDIPWDKEAVYDFYAGPPNFWTREQVDTNLFTRYDADITQHSRFDPDSIMLYPIPNDFTVGDFEVGWNKDLSETDKRYIRTLYPAESKSTGELVVDAPPVEASLGDFGEIDEYTFTVPRKAPYRVEIEGPANLLLTLFGPDDPTRPVDMDDDSGVDRNARVTPYLRPGAYVARIHHKSPGAAGSYRIGVSQPH